MISTVSSPKIGKEKQEIDDKKQVKEELVTETAEVRSKKINSHLELATCYMLIIMYSYNF